MVQYGKFEFEWDSNKETANIKKHGVEFFEAVESFADPEGFLMSDRSHSTEEERYYWIGKSFKDRVLTTRFTWRGSVIRIIGSAYWREYGRLYHETTKNK